MKSIQMLLIGIALSPLGLVGAEQSATGSSYGLMKVIFGGSVLEIGLWLILLLSSLWIPLCFILTLVSRSLKEGRLPLGSKLAMGGGAGTLLTTVLLMAVMTIGYFGLVGNGGAPMAAKAMWISNLHWVLFFGGAIGLLDLGNISLGIILRRRSKTSVMR